MHKLYELEETIEKEIDQIIAQGCVKPDQWENLGEAVDILKDISTVKAMEGGSYDNGGSYGYNSYGSYGPYDNYRMPRMRSYDGDMIDSRGSRDNGMGSGNSYNNSYGNSGMSRGRGSYESGENVHEAIMLLERKLDHTQDPKMRESLMATIDMMKGQR